uniref:uncharacterized protein LOC120330345 n=1 Tax=Styela clava TaxID=7725 RepID=UPI00193A86C5|nr:uncharacterized protein LOC120330345 [Styela clava]
MWRIGHEYAEQKQGKKVKRLPSVVRQKSIIEKRDSKTSNARHKLPEFNSPKMIDPRTRRGSIIATEHLMRRRSSRGGKHLTAPFIANDAVSLDHIKYGQHVRRPSVAVRLGKINEIKERINKVMTNYDAPSDGKDSEDEELLNEIEEGLADIEDDMMRINISALIGRFKKIQRYCDESNIGKMSTVKLPEKTNDALQSLQDWIERDRFDETDDDDEPHSPVLDVLDNEVVSAGLSQVAERMDKLKFLKQKIRNLKTTGNDTHHLERQRQNLQLQMRNEVMRLQEQKKNGKTESHREFAYIKNAATEIYDLIQKTKLEGMAHAHQFEEQLHMILRELDKKKGELNSLQKISDGQKEMLDKWAEDYEKLHNELIMTADERNEARDSIRKLKKEISQLKHRINNLEKSLKTGEIVTRAEHEDALADIEKSLKHAKQNLVVLGKTLEEKNNKINELSQQTNRLKQSLRKQSSVSLHSDMSFHHSISEAGSRSMQRNCMSQNSSKSLISSTHSFVQSSQENLIASLKEEIESLRDKLYKTKNRNRPNSDTNDSHQSGEHIITARKMSQKLASQETQTTESYVQKIYKAPNVAIGDAPLPRQIVGDSVGCQTSPPALLQFMTLSVREDLAKTCQMLSEKIGPDWVEVALKFSALERDDIFELNKGLSLQSDIMRMYSGSPTKTQRFYETESEAAQESQMEKVIEQMLQGEIPDRIELKKLDSARSIDCHLQEMTSRVATYVSNVKNAVNNQAGMMSEVNDCLKQCIPEEEMEKLELEMGKKQKDASCSEHSKEWQDMDSLEKANCKMRYIEETIFNLMKETNKIYETEIDKQHETYKNLHSIAKKSTNDSVFQAISENIANKVKNIKVKAKSRASQERTKIFPHNHTSIILSSFKKKPDESLTSISRVESFEENHTKAKRILSGFLWNYEGKPSDEYTRGHGSEYHHPPEQTQTGLLKSQYHTGVKLAHPVGPTSFSTPVKRGKAKAGKNKSRGLGLLIQPVGNKETAHFPKHQDKDISNFLNSGTGSHARGSIFSKREKLHNHKFTLLDVHSNLYDPKFQKLVKSSGMQRDVNFGVENVKLLGGTSQRKNTQYRKYFSEAKSPFVFRQ